MIDNEIHLIGEKITFILNTAKEVVTLKTEIEGKNIISGKNVRKTIDLAPYEYLWIK